MPDFAYIARDMKGQKVIGSIAAPSEREALSLLAGQSLFPVEVKNGSQSAPERYRNSEFLRKPWLAFIAN